MGRRLALQVSAAIGICLAALPAAAADWPVGTMTDLGTLGGRQSYAAALSADGSIIVGHALLSGDLHEHAVFWSNGMQAPIDLGTLGGDYSGAYAVSADGTVIIGYASLSNNQTHAVSWVNGANTPTDLGALDGGASTAVAVSADGTTIVGISDMSGGYRHAVSWVNGATAPTDLGALSGNFSSAAAVSADGSVIIGESSLSSGYRHAVSWTNGATMPTDLGTLGGNFSFAAAVSANGSVIAGLSERSDGFTHAVSWTNGATTPTDLGALGGHDFSKANAVSADGSVIIGESNGVGSSRAVSWSNGATTPTDLGTLSGSDYSSAVAVSANGSVIVGTAESSDGRQRAVSWMNGATAPTDLGTLGGSSSSAVAVSADGKVIVGRSETSTPSELRAFVLRLQPATPPIMQDLENVHRSVPRLANDTAVAFDRQAGILADLLGAECSVPTGAAWCLDTALSGSFVSGQQEALTGRLALGYALTEEITGGIAFAVTARDRLGDSAFDIATMPSVSLWSGYSAGGATGAGLQLELAAAYGEAHADITRGRGLDNVQEVDGDADLATIAAKAGIGYGFAGEGWLITPSVAVTTYHMSRSSYDEDDDADFPAKYDRLTSDLTTLTLSLAGEMPIGDKSRLGLKAGVVADLDYDEAKLQGTSIIPGMGAISQSETLDRHDIRPFLDAAYSFAVGARSALRIGAGLSQAAYGDDPAFRLSVGYGTAF